MVLSIGSTELADAVLNYTDPRTSFGDELHHMPTYVLRSEPYVVPSIGQLVGVKILVVTQHLYLTGFSLPDRRHFLQHRAIVSR